MKVLKVDVSRKFGKSGGFSSEVMRQSCRPKSGIEISTSWKFECCYQVVSPSTTHNLVAQPLVHNTSFVSCWLCSCVARPWYRGPGPGPWVLALEAGVAHDWMPFKSQKILYWSFQLNEANCIWLVRLLDELYSLASHTLCREELRGWSCCNHRVVTMERNYWTKQSDNKMLTFGKHVVT